MIQCICTVFNCFFVANYHSTTIEQIRKCPPFHNMPLLDGEHEHKWKIKEIKIGK